MPDWYDQKKILFIHSKDDPMVSYKSSIEVINSLNNPSIKTISLDNRMHNPNYTDDAVTYLNDVFTKYNELISKKVIKTDKDKIKYFKNVSIEKLTEQDEKIFDEIVSFIEMK